MTKPIHYFLNAKPWTFEELELSEFKRIKNRYKQLRHKTNKNLNREILELLANEEWQDLKQLITLNYANSNNRR